METFQIAISSNIWDGRFQTLASITKKISFSRALLWSSWKLKCDQYRI
jgi:hypothetical protein